MRTRRTRAAAKEEEDAEAAAAVAAVEVAEAIGVPAAALADAAADAAAADGSQPAAQEPAAEPAAADSAAADPAAAEPAPDAGAVPIDPGVDAPPPDGGDTAAGYTSALQQPAADSAAEMAAEPPPGGEEATIPAAKAGEMVPPGQQATGITTITAETAGAAQAILGNRPPQPASDLLQPAGATPGGDPLPRQAQAAAPTAGITPAAEAPAPDAVHGQPAEPPAPEARAQALHAEGATPAANGAAESATAPAPAAAPGEQPAADATPAAPKRKRRSKWDTTADATPVPAPAAAAPAPDTGIPGLANGSAALPPPPDAGAAIPATGLPPGTPGVLPALPVVTPFVRKRGAARWGPIPGTETEPKPESTPDGQPPKKKRKSRWETAEDTSMALTKLTPGGVPEQLILPGNIVVRLPSTMTGLPDRSADPEVAAIQDELEDLNKRLQTGELNIPPEGERSPSPEPIYDRNGIRQNTRDMRVKERMQSRRQELVEEMIKRDPLYRPPADYRPAKKWKKIWIPQKEYPGTNFIGLIIGPRGNTQKRMQRETNTKIAIRGRGSVKEGAARDPRNDYGEDEELHVLITGDKQTDVDTAADMIADLMQPEDEARNEHKRMQLRELAALNGTLKEFEEQPCFLCGETGHRQWECPNTKEEGFKLSEEMQSKVQALYARDIARREGGDVAGAVSQEDEYKAFLSQLGGGAPGAAATPRPGAPSTGIRHEGLGFRPRGRPGDELPDSCKLYVGSLPDSVTDDTLRNEFSKYGEVLHAIVLKDMATQMSRGYGFVHMSNEETARAAADGMHGKMIEGRAIVARLRSGAPPPKPMQRQDVPDDAKLYVSNLPSSMTNDLLRSVFTPFGETLDARAIGSNVGPCRGFGFVTMGTVEAAAAAIKGINGYKMADKMLSVRIAGQPRPPGGPQGGPPGAGGPPLMRPAYGAPRPPGGPPGAPLPPGTPPGAPPQGAPPPYGAPRPPPGYGAPPPGYGAPPPGYGAPYGAPPPYGMPPPYGYPHGYGAPPPYGYAPSGYGAPPMGAYPPAYGAPPGAAPPPPGSAPPDQSYGAPPPAPPPEASAPPQPAAAPAWQPPLPQEAPKAPEVKAEPQQQVMSEYERFMAEMGQALP